MSTVDYVFVKIWYPEFLEEVDFSNSLIVKYPSLNETALLTVTPSFFTLKSSIFYRIPVYWTVTENEEAESVKI